jgi:ABC-type multidrug transport system fused ATPase/permease subunit
MQIRSLSRYEERHAKAFAKSVSITVEAVNSMKTIATLSLEHEVMGTYSRVLKASKNDIVGASLYTNVWLALSISTGFFVYAFAYWWGGQLITKGEYTQQQFFIVVIAMLVSAQLWGQMFTLAPEVSRSRAAASRILSLIQAGSGDDSKPHREEDPSSPTEKDIEHTANSSTLAPPPSSSNSRGLSITFTDVNFSYPNRTSILALQDATFTIQPGQFIGLVGPSGAGKSTIMSLVQGTYIPTSGTVTLDNIPISPRTFRDEIAIVPQDNALFNGTIKFNVSLGARPNHEATDAEIEDACKIANIHDTIMALPNKYDTEVGPNGSQLSGGQRQRLTIARALVRKPRLLLLDESTSALDADSEMALQKGLERVVRSEGITVLAITHRLHTVVRADCILVVEGGRVVDKGRHEELVARRETYRDNATHQMLQ